MKKKMKWYKGAEAPRLTQGATTEHIGNM